MCAFIGWELGGLESEEPYVEPPKSKPKKHIQYGVVPSFVSQPSTSSRDDTLAVNDPDALQNERILTFGSEDSLEEFVAQASRCGICILGRNPRFNTLRVGFSDWSRVQSILPEDSESFFNFPMIPPPLEDGMMAPGAMGFHGRMKEWMGISEDNAHWGEGVSVAVIDTGILPHPVFDDGVEVFSLVDSKGEIHPHGTAMASLWRDTDGRIPAIAPAVDLSSIQVADETGVSNTFMVAEAIYLAAESGTDLITISMSSARTSPYLDRAIEFAKEQGSLIIASSGNNGQEIMMYPAAHDDVLAVGAIDYNNAYPGFSNYGEHVSFVAPGVGVLAAGPDDTYGSSSGTSPAAQIGAATIAAVMSELEISDPYAASELYLENLNELGLPDKDTLYGYGRPQMDVLLNYDEPGRYDGAIAGNLIELDERGQADLHVIVDNPGTENLTQALLHVTAQGESYEVSLPTIEPKESYQFTLPLSASLDQGDIMVSSRVELADGLDDVRPQDNSQHSKVGMGEGGE